MPAATYAGSNRRSAARGSTGVPAMNLGFVGLGAMGAGIVPRLMAAGHEVTGFNRDHEKAKPLIEGGMHFAASPREVAAVSEVVFSIVTDAAAVKAVALGEE